MAAVVRIFAITDDPRDAASVALGALPDHERAPPPGNRFAARGLGVPLGVAVGLPLTLGLYGLIYFGIRALGGF